MRTLKGNLVYPWIRKNSGVKLRQIRKIFSCVLSLFCGRSAKIFSFGKCQLIGKGIWLFQNIFPFCSSWLYLENLYCSPGQSRQMVSILQLLSPGTIVAQFCAVNKNLAFYTWMDRWILQLSKTVIESNRDWVEPKYGPSWHGPWPLLKSTPTFLGLTRVLLGTCIVN